MELTTRRQFLITMISFAVLGAAFKVMVLVEGLTEVRPANAIPMIAGLAFGPVGALGCGVGNLIADLFGTFDWTSALGFAGNFAAAYLPYRLWYLFRDESPNVHTWKNLALFGWLSLLSALTVAWLLGFGLELFFGLWIQNFYLYVLFNNFGFSMALGLPLFIVFTSDSVRLAMHRPQARRMLPKNRMSAQNRSALSRLTAAVYTLGLLFIFLEALQNRHLANSATVKIISGFCLPALLALCIIPGSEGGNHDTNEA